MKKMRTFTLQKRVFALLAFVLLLVGCREDTEVWSDTNTTEAVTFTIKVPGSPTASARSIAEGGDDDKKVLTIDLLLFDQSSKMYVGKVLSDKIVDVNATEKKFTITLPKGRYDIMILANARSVVNAAIVPANSPLTKNKSEIHDLLIKTLPNKTENPLTGIWNAQPGSAGYQHFPMWSDKLDFKVPASGTDLSVALVRMLAKVNVTFKAKEVSDKLTIESIMVCNFNKSGYLASHKWDFGTEDAVAQSQNNVDENASRAIGVANGLIYANTAEHPSVIRKESDIQVCMDEIFLFESHKPANQTDEQQRMEATCLILKAKYDGGSEDRYYRIDFANREGTTVNYLSLLRNHIYSIVINSVNTAGHPSAEIAYQSFAADLNIGISSWNDGGVGETAFDGQYTLSVTPSELEVFRDASTGNSFIIHTDYPVAPTITGIDYTDAAWITNISAVVRKPALDKESGKKKAYQVTFDCLENKTGNSRLAKINVTAGRHLNLKVNVTQTATPILTLRIDDITVADNVHQDITELLFASGLHTSDPITSKSISISWAPHINDAPCRSIATPIGTDFAFGTGTTLPSGNVALTSATGTIDYTGIHPLAFTKEEVAKPHEFLEKTRLYTYTVSNGVKSMNKSLMLHQVHYNAVADTASYYLMDGKEHSFNVRSNSGWRITLGGKDGSNGDPKNVIKTFTPVQGGYDTNSGQTVKFTLKDDITPGALIGQAHVKFTITSTDPLRKFDPIEVSINALAGIVRELSNCYMVFPSASPILIPVRRANGLLRDNSTTPETNWWLGTQIEATGEKAKFGVKLLWTEEKGTNGKSLASDGVVKDVRTVGSGDKGYIMVFPGSKAGNALVAITRTPGVDGAEGTGDILWSFHIWVTDYYPYDASGNAKASGKNNYWMNRNLGARTNILGTVDAFGLFYQYGRKDPFPKAATLTSTGTGGGKPIYSSDGEIVTLPSKVDRATALGTVRNPMILVNNWYGTNETNAVSVLSDPWDYNAKKTLYDPCPKGFRLPQYKNEPTSDTSRDWGNVDNNANGDGISTAKWLGNGIEWKDKGGFYPAAGYLAPGLGLPTYYDTGTYGYAWSATAIPGANSNAFALRFSSGNMKTNNYSIKNSAGSIRCIAE